MKALFQGGPFDGLELEFDLEEAQQEIQLQDLPGGDVFDPTKSCYVFRNMLVSEGRQAARYRWKVS